MSDAATIAAAADWLGRAKPAVSVCLSTARRTASAIRPHPCRHLLTSLLSPPQRLPSAPIHRSDGSSVTARSARRFDLLCCRSVCPPGSNGGLQREGEEKEPSNRRSGGVGGCSPRSLHQSARSNITRVSDGAMADGTLAVCGRHDWLSPTVAEGTVVSRGRTPILIFCSLFTPYAQLLAPNDRRGCTHAHAAEWHQQRRQSA